MRHLSFRNKPIVWILVVAVLSIFGSVLIEVPQASAPTAERSLQANSAKTANTQLPASSLTSKAAAHATPVSGGNRPTMPTVNQSSTTSTNNMQSTAPVRISPADSGNTSPNPVVVPPVRGDVTPPPSNVETTPPTYYCHPCSMSGSGSPASGPMTPGMTPGFMCPMHVCAPL